MVGSEAVSSLFDAHLVVPRPPVLLLARPRVSALLDDAVANHPVTLVTGGAGSGKTLAVAAWARTGHPPGPVAWVSVDRSIGTTRLWTAIVESLGKALGREGLGHLLVVPNTIDADFVGAFADEFAGCEASLVIDDVQELNGGDAWDMFDHLLRLLPRGPRLVLVARHDPPLALNRLRLAGALGELRAADLAFTEDEARQLLEDRSLHLPDQQVRHLMDTTEGWAAGLRLALMTLEAADEPAAAVEAFSGRQGLVAGYLVEEVLRTIGPARAEFLSRTSVTDRVCGPLARVLTGDPAALATLRGLARENAHVVELEDSGWFRYHPLLLQMLRARLRAEEPELERDLHRRAATWHEESGEWLAALEQAIEIQDWDLVARIALRSAAVLVFTSDRAGLGTLLSRIPPHLAHGRPDLAVTLALGAFCRHDRDAEAALCSDAAPRIAGLEEPLRTLATLNLRVLQATSARRAGDAPAMTMTAHEALAAAGGLTAAQAPGWAAFRGAAHGVAAVAELWSGHPRRAEQLLAGAVAYARPSDFESYGVVYHQGLHALTQLASGRITRARSIGMDALTTAERTGSHLRHEAAAAHLAVAGAEVQRGEARSAAVALEHGRLAARRGRDPFIGAGLSLVAARRGILVGDLPAARRLLGDVEARLAAHPGMTLIRRQRTALWVELELAAGTPARAETHLAEFDAMAGEQWDPAEPDTLAPLRGRVLLARGRAESARTAVAAQLGHGGSVGAEAWLVVALAEDRLRRDAASTQALANALDLAEREEAIFPFLRPTDRLASLLRRHLDVVGSHRDFIDAVLATSAGPAPAGSTPATVEALTDRELSVLAYLPTMSSNTEIAGHLGISVNTVKQHLKAIHRKLGVTSRRDAVRVARRRGLLPDSR